MAYAKQFSYDKSNTNVTRAVTLAAQQINYMLGDCGRSWVVGYGEGSPKLPYHKSSYNSFIDYPMRGTDNGDQESDFLYSNTTNRFILYGALEGGPAWDDTFLDNRHNYEYTEVWSFSGISSSQVLTDDAPNRSRKTTTRPSRVSTLP